MAKKITLDYPISPDCLTLFYNVIANCGKKQVDCSVMVEYTIPENGNQADVYQSDITGNCLEELPNGYDQDDLQAQLEAEAINFVPLSIKCTPTFKDESHNTSCLAMIRACEKVLISKIKSEITEDDVTNIIQQIQDKLRDFIKIN